MKTIKILTTFPEFYDSFLNTSIIKRAISKSLVEIKIINLREYTNDKHHRTDSKKVGYGPGLILKCQPIIDALRRHSNDSTLKIVLTPRGKTFKQNIAEDIISKYDDIIILCGHYEGIDERVYSYFDLELSLGDFILTGGEVASLVIIDSLTRLIDGVINKESLEEETFSGPFLEYPQYTLPYEFEGRTIPDILFSGNHEVIKRYNLKKSIEYTLKYRPDLLKNYTFTPLEKELLYEIENNIESKEEKEALIKGKKFLKDKKD